MTHKVTMYWRTKDRFAISRIRERFGIKRGMTVNGETDVDISDEDMPLFEETARRGYFDIRHNNRSEYYPLIPNR